MKSDFPIAANVVDIRESVDFKGIRTLVVDTNAWLWVTYTGDFAEGEEELQEYKQAVKNGVVQVYNEYIELLIEELEETVSIAYAHGWTSSRYKKGKELRQKIQDKI